MTRDEAKQFISTLEEGVDKDVRLGLSTRSICKVGNNKFEINDFVDGWSTATVSESTLEDVLCGEKSLLQLDWM